MKHKQFESFYLIDLNNRYNGYIKTISKNAMGVGIEYTHNKYESLRVNGQKLDEILKYYRNIGIEIAK